LIDPNKHHEAALLKVLINHVIMKNYLFLLAAFFLFLFNGIKAKSQTNFQVLTGVTLTGLQYSSVDWGDYNNDGWLDFVLCGYDGTSSVTKIYKNNGNNTFTQTGLSLTGVKNGSVAWGDYNNDGWLDIFLTGYTGSIHTAILYENLSGTLFSQQSIPGITCVKCSDISWGDFNNDGWMDIIYCGLNGANCYTKLYKNNGNNTFSLVTSTSFSGVSNGSVDWGDYDNDGWIDLLLVGYNGSIPISKIYHNNKDATFTEQISIPLIGVKNGNGAWGDYNNDGWLDIVLIGNDGNTAKSIIYKNNGDSTFTEQMGIALDGLEYGNASWGDYNNDGNTDLVISGYDSLNSLTKVYMNNGSNSFTLQTSISLSGIKDGCNAWADYNNDGKLDLLITGFNDTVGISKIYTNLDTTANKKPLAPAGLHAVISYNDTTMSNKVTLFWNKSTDSITPQNGLSYNIYLRKTVGAVDGYSPLSNTSNGYRKVVRLGNTYCDTSWSFNNLTAGTYLWSVQTLDNGYMGGNFAIEDTFKVISFFDEQTNINLIGVWYSSMAWGDYDNDGWLDILLCGYTGSGAVTRVYKNNGNGTFTNQAGIVLTAVGSGSVVWGDYNNDGLLDILISGGNGGYYYTKIYKNNGNNTFTEQTGISLAHQGSRSVAWGDYNNDGWLDILIAGTSLYKNNGNNTFTDQVGIGLVPAGNGCVAWGDYNNDGWLDILITGYDGFSSFSKIYKNNGNNTFSEQTGIDIVPVNYSHVAWGDYNNDGWLDFVISGDSGGVYPNYYISRIYKNNGDGTFTKQTGIPLVPMRNSDIAWGDINNDGLLDLILVGEYLSKIYLNNGNNTFSEPKENSLPNWNYSGVALGDYDNDGDLDLMLSGNDNTHKYSKVYMNTCHYLNSNPDIPLSLQSNVVGADATLTWNKTTDDLTPQDGISYNIYVGSGMGSIDKLSPMADVSNGFRKVVCMGNTFSDTTKTISNLPIGTYYWSVQGIDNAFKGSAFATEGTFDILVTDIDEQDTNTIFSIFPNPASQSIYLKNNSGEFISIDVYDIFSHLVYHNETLERKTKIDVESFAHGIYLIMIKGDDLLTTKKIIVD
jgi:hypothetical protein